MTNPEARIAVTYITDPGCPWGYSALPALRVLEWRYGTQLAWRPVMIGLAEDAQQYVDRGYEPGKLAAFQVTFRERWGMPFVLAPKPRMSATSPACRLVVAAGIDAPEHQLALLRELQLLQFTRADLLLDEPATFTDLLAASPRLAGLDVPALVARVGDADVRERYEADRAEAREAAGRAGALQGKLANTDGADRYTAPSLRFSRAGAREDDVVLEAAGFQPVEAYDVLIANLDPALERRAPADDVREVLAAFPAGLTTAEVAAVCTAGNDAPDRAGAERALIAALATGDVRREQLGDDAVWMIG